MNQQMQNWKQKYDFQVQEKFNQEMNNLINTHQAQIQKLQKKHSIEISELTNYFQTLVKEQDSIISLDKVTTLFFQFSNIKVESSFQI